MAMAVGAIRSEPGAPGAPGAPGSLFKIPVGSQSSGYPQGEQKISGVLDLFFYPGVGHFCVITPGHFSIDVSNVPPRSRPIGAKNELQGRGPGST